MRGCGDCCRSLLLSLFVKNLILVRSDSVCYLGVTSCPASRTPYMRDLTIFYISTLSMLFDVCDQSCWQSCVTPVEIRVDVLALCIPVF